MKLQKNKIILILILISLPLMGFGCKGGDRKAQQAAKPMTIEVWGVWDDQDYWSQIFNDYRLSHPNVKFNYRKLRIEEYEKALLEAWAEGKGPDIFMMHNTWIPKYRSKLEPLPSKISLPVKEIKGTFKKEQIWTMKNFNLPTTEQLKEKFVDIVTQDAIDDNKVYALPMALDTLALYYNTEIFNAANIASPPETWAEFKETVKKITRLNEENKIVQSAVAMGRADNVERATDILSVLMMQNGAQMVGVDGLPRFDKTPNGSNYNPGLQALVFYTDFANPIKETYTWDDNFKSSLDAFAQGKTAMMFGYSYHAPLIRTKGPRISFRIAPLPQIDKYNRQYNFANYWVMGVTKKSNSRIKNSAWDFLIFASTKEKEAEKYLKKSGKAPALRSLINKELKSTDRSVFASQVLTSQSWYRGYNAIAAEEIMKQMIDNVIKGNFSDLKKLLKNSVEQIKQTYHKPSFIE